VIAYTRDEIISVSDITRSFSSVFGNILNKTKEKIAISKNNKLEAVIVNIDEYEKLKEASNILEHMDIYNTVQQRSNSDTITLEDSAKKYDINLDDL